MLNFSGMARSKKSPSAPCITSSVSRLKPLSANPNGTKLAPPNSSASPTKLFSTKSAPSAWRTDDPTRIVILSPPQADEGSDLRGTGSQPVLFPHSPMQRHNSSGPSLKCRLAESRALHHLLQRLRPGKFPHRLRQIRIRIPAPGNRASDSRQNPRKIKSVE